MWRKTILVLAVCGLLVGATGLRAAEVARETRGVWLWGSVVRKQGADKLAAELEKHHINTVFLLVKGISGEVSWQSKIALKQAAGPDLLKAFAVECKKRDIDLHVWFVVNSDQAWISKHPEDGFYHSGGKQDQPEIYKIDQPRICPLADGYRDYLLSLMREIISQPDTYPVKGVHLDYIRYPMIVYCFCPRHQAKAPELGIRLGNVREAIRKTLYGEKKTEYYYQAFKKGDPDVKKWVEMREAEIERIVRDVRALVDEVNPELKLSAAFMPEGGEADDTYGRCNYGQNYVALGKYLDFLVPMTYHREFKKKPTWPAELAARSAQRTGTTVFAGFGDMKDAKEVIEAVRGRQLPGFVLFRYGTVKPEEWSIWDAEVKEPARPVTDTRAPVLR